MALMPVPERASELLDFTGKWCRERAPQRRAFGYGTQLRRARRGKPGHDSPFLLMAGSAEFGFGRGEVWAAHLAWSGEQQYLAERLPEGAGALAAVIGVGESLRPGEVLLADGERYEAPTAVFVWSGSGMDGIAHRLHDRLRARPTIPRRRGRSCSTHGKRCTSTTTCRGSPVSSIGPPRSASNGSYSTTDGSTDAETPRGSRRLVRRLHDLARRARAARRPRPRPWHAVRAVVRARDGQPRLRSRPRAPGLDPRPVGRARPAARNQYVLDMPDRKPTTTSSSGSTALVREYAIDYLKWDHNRDSSRRVTRADGDRPGVHRQTLALYRMLDELRARHPRLEIETLLRRRRPDRPRNPRSHGPRVGLRLQRPGRTRRDRAVDSIARCHPSSSDPTSAPTAPTRPHARPIPRSASPPRSAGTRASSRT